ncbi:hypothetical protein Pla175_42810 [Pirellulimonas nuda]|uniref:Flavinylation-associated cytochrome domain-containing protein n=1 Tax=Pirellulimonas nuda TaxID=2528009 RepID=A0A518DHB4_9BACT|nr:DUF4405 domain-containing protein [Pirellulimonas nuda]QDU90868.1 hypothetical protein Pla175_42810 [Pirellulimonas nuda]
MTRTWLNFCVDALAAVEFAFLASTGLLIHALLPAGSGHWLTLWGLDRHAWGALHFWVAMAMLATVGVHLALHWKWVVCVVGGKPKDHRRLRLGIASALAVAVLLALATPFTATIRSQAPGDVEVADRGAVRADHEAGDAPLLSGRTTLGELQAATGVTPAMLAQELGVNGVLEPSDRIGPLRQHLGMEMTELRAAIERAESLRGGANPEQSEPGDTERGD